MSVTVYTKPGCVQCNATVRKLDELHIPYELVDLTTDGAALAYVRDELGHSQAPVVVANADHWRGYRPDRLAALAN